MIIVVTLAKMLAGPHMAAAIGSREASVIFYFILRI